MTKCSNQKFFSSSSITLYHIQYISKTITLRSLEHSPKLLYYSYVRPVYLWYTCSFIFFIFISVTLTKRTWVLLKRKHFHRIGGKFAQKLFFFECLQIYGHHSQCFSTSSVHRHYGGPVEGHPKAPRILQNYGTEGFQWDPQLVLHYAKRRIQLYIYNWIWFGNKTLFHCIKLLYSMMKLVWIYHIR